MIPSTSPARRAPGWPASTGPDAKSTSLKRPLPAARCDATWRFDAIGVASHCPRRPLRRQGIDTGTAPSLHTPPALGCTDGAAQCCWKPAHGAPQAAKCHHEHGCAELRRSQIQEHVKQEIDKRQRDYYLQQVAPFRLGAGRQPVPTSKMRPGAKEKALTPVAKRSRRSCRRSSGWIPAVARILGANDLPAVAAAALPWNGDEGQSRPPDLRYRSKQTTWLIWTGEGAHSGI